MCGCGRWMIVWHRDSVRVVGVVSLVWLVQLVVVIVYGVGVSCRRIKLVLRRCRVPQNVPRQRECHLIS